MVAAAQGGSRYGSLMPELLPYGIGAHAETHPIRLATLAAMHGVAAAPADHCRVLEIGCAQAGNIMDLADAYPESTFVGVEISEPEVALAHQYTQQLGLTNLDVRCLSLADIDDTFGLFDYVIAHGVYCWVPDDVRDDLMRVCSEHLAPGGVAYISYTTYPGWAMGDTIRSLLLDHVRDIDDRAERVAAARERLARLLDEIDPSTPYGAYLLDRCAALLSYPDAYLDHDHLAPISRALHLHEMVEHAAANDLRYLDDIIVTDAPPMDATDRVPAGLDDVRPQHTYDLVHGTSFRAAVLCRADESLRPQPTLGELALFQVSAPVAVEGALSVADQSVAGFSTRKGGTLRTGSPVMKAALAELADCWPASLAIADLAGIVDAHIPPELRAGTGGDTSALLTRDLANLHRQGLVELATQAYPFVSVLSERPMVAAAARLAAGLGAQVANRRHEQLDLDDVLLMAAQLLDGSRTVADVTEGLIEEANAGRLQMGRPDGSSMGPTEQREALEQLVPRALEILLGTALLIG